MFHNRIYTIGVEFQNDFLLLYFHAGPLAKNGGHRDEAAMDQPPLERPGELLSVHYHEDQMEEKYGHGEVQTLVGFFDDVRLRDYHECDVYDVGYQSHKAVAL